MKKLTRLQIRFPKADYDRMIAQFALLFNYGWEETENADEAIFTVFCENSDFIENAAEKLKGQFGNAKISITAEEIPDPLESWKEFFTPVECGDRFIILPPWLADMDTQKRHKILINPKSAFGTGHHASTCLCLKMLDWLLASSYIVKNDRFLDLGCGTGVLAIAAALAGLSGMAMDNDPIAVDNARENCALNKVNLRLNTGDENNVLQNEYNLIMANILAQPLIDMAASLAGGLKQKGCLILSGILQTQGEKVKKAYLEQGLKHIRSILQDEWEALAFVKMHED